MTAPIAREKLDFLVSNKLAYTSPVPEGMEGAVDDTYRPGLFAKLAQWFSVLAAIPRRRAVLDELNMLSDRELADVGLSRAELSRVFDPAFVEARHRPQGLRSSRI